MTMAAFALDTTDTPRPTLRHIALPGCEAETWVVESAYHHATEVVAVVPATGDAEPGWEVVWTVDGDRSCYDWSESRAKMVESARELATARLAELAAEHNEWLTSDDLTT